MCVCCMSVYMITSKLLKVSAFCLVVTRLEKNLRTLDNFACQDHRARSKSLLGGFKVTQQGYERE